MKYTFQAILGLTLLILIVQQLRQGHPRSGSFLPMTEERQRAFLRAERQERDRLGAEHA